MPRFSGVFVSIATSLTAWPLVSSVTNYKLLSEPLPLMIIGFIILGVLIGVVEKLLPPSEVKGSPEKGLEGRGLFYYICCVFMWASVADLVLQCGHLALFGKNKNTVYYEHGEVYLATPHGIMAQFWNAVANYFMYVVIIYQIDNDIDHRDMSLYWCGSVITSQFTVVLGALTGSYSDKLEYSVWMNVIWIIVPVWVFCHFLAKPRILSDSDKIARPPSKFQWVDKYWSIGLLLASSFSCVRGLGALGSKIPFIENYVVNFEPYILDPSHFGSLWILYTALYGIPFQLAAIYSLFVPGCKWMLNLVVFYASANLQGTTNYLAYSWFPSSQSQYRISDDKIPLVLTLNIGCVVLAHILMVRCFNNKQHFMGTTKSTLENSRASGESLGSRKNK